MAMMVGKYRGLISEPLAFLCEFCGKTIYQTE